MSRGGKWKKGNNSASQDLIRDNLEDLGLDHFGDEDRLPPQLYPAVTLPVSEHPNEDLLYTIQRNRDMSARFMKSPFYMSRKNPPITKAEFPVEDVDLDWQLWSTSGSVPEEWKKYCPHELFLAKSKNKSKSKLKLNFQSLEQAENKGVDDEENEGEDDEENLEDMEVEEEDEGDYDVDHYASGDEGDDDDGGEPTF